MQEFKKSLSIEIGQQPLLFFQGDPFDVSEKHIKFKNMMLDFFRIKHLQSMNILAAQRIITFTAKTVEGQIVMKQFEAGTINEGLAGDGDIEITEIGPNIDMTLKRIKHADNDMWKSATKVSKSKKKQIEKKRNISHNELGQTVGKAYIQHQDLSTLALKKMKRRKGAEVEEGEEEDKELNINEAEGNIEEVEIDNDEEDDEEIEVGDEIEEDPEEFEQAENLEEDDSSEESD